MSSRFASLVLVGIVLAGCAQTTQSPSASGSAPAPSAPASTSPPMSQGPAPESAAPSASAGPIAEGESRMLRVMAAGVRMRAEPSTNGELVVALPAGASVLRTEADPVEADDLTWYEVRAGTLTGWVASGTEGDWLAKINNGRIGFACIACGDSGSRAAATVQPDGSGLQILMAESGSATWSPDGTQVVIEHETPGSFERNLTLMAADGSDATPLGTGSGAAWSPDGEWLAFSRSEAGTLVVIDPDGRRFDLTVNDHSAPGSLAWSPDSSRLAFVAVDCDECPTGEPIMGDVPSGIYLFTPPMGEIVRLVERGYYGQLTWSVDGRSLTYFSTDLSVGANEVRRVELSSGTTTTLLNDSSLLNGWELSPDGTRLVAMSDEGIVVSDPDGRNPLVAVPTTGDMNPTPVAPRWSPDGQWILFDMFRTSADPIETWIARADGSGEPRRVSEDAYEASWQSVLVALTD